MSGRRLRFPCFLIHSARQSFSGLKLFSSGSSGGLVYVSSVFSSFRMSLSTSFSPLYPARQRFSVLRLLSRRSNGSVVRSALPAC